MSPTRLIALIFAALILMGTLLLSLPVSSRSGQSCGVFPALFTATSATCVTGLVLFDTFTQWSSFGQTVIICLIEVGGLGFMAAASLVFFLLRKKVGLKQKMVLAQTLSVDDMQDVVRLQKRMLVGSLLIQLTGALILFLRFLPQYGVGRAAIWGVFHAISAFCNAGFDIFGYIEQGKGLMLFNTDPVVCITLMLLVTVGGLGFFVWDDVLKNKKFKNLTVYTKLVLVTSGVLILGGAVLFLLLEWNNPATIGTMGVGDKILNSFFQSVTLRTAGFSAIDQGQLAEGSKALSIVLMFIGGSSGSTAGGVKTVTFMVVLLFVGARLRGRSNVTVFRRTVLMEKVMDAMLILSVVFGLAMFGAVVICSTSAVSFADGLYEAVSALATVGLTAGGTANLSIAAQILLIIYMYFGRVGILTISIGFMTADRAEDRIRWAYTNLLIG